MLVIVNPYATTVSDRLRNLVVYALQGRYDVEAVDTEARDHATALTREAASEGYDVVVAFGGDGTVNEAANGLRGSSTPLTCLPGGSTNVYGRMLGIPNDIVDATEHLLRLADDWRPRDVDMAVVNGRALPFSSGLGLDAARRRARRQPPAPQGPLRPVLLRLRRLRRVPGQATSPARRASRSSPTAARRRPGSPSLVQKGDPYTYFRRIPIHASDGTELTDPTLSGVVLRTLAPDGHARRPVAAVLGQRAPRAPPPGRRLRRRGRARGAQHRRAPRAAARRRRLHRRRHRGGLRR